jgi:hypothetical protein
MVTKVLLSKDDAPGTFEDLWDGGDEPIMRPLRRDLTATEVGSLYSKPVTLLAGQPGKVYRPVAGVMVSRFGTTPYAASGAYLYVGTPDTGQANLIGALGAILGTGEDSILDMYPGEYSPGTPMPLSLFEGAPLMVRAEEDPTGGDGGLSIGILYRVLTP